jgi:hypothetical protein
LIKDLDNVEAICISQEKRAKKIGEITVHPWQQALRKYFTVDL